MSAADVGALLARALERAADAAGRTLTIERSGWTRWASATFTGARHEVALALADQDGAAEWLATLPEAEFALRGQLVADLRVVTATRDAAVLRATLEVLTVEER